MVRNVFFVFMFSMPLVLSMDGYYPPSRGSSAWGYFIPAVAQRPPPKPHRTEIEVMVDLTNNLGVAILQDHTFSKSNFAFSPYGVASVLVVLYEGARGESAEQIRNAVKFPADRNTIRTGFREIHLHLRSYFNHESYLSGISLNKDGSTLKQEYKKILSFYGYDVDFNETLNEDSSPATEASPFQEITTKPDVGINNFIHNGSQNVKNSTAPSKNDTGQNAKPPYEEKTTLVTDDTESEQTTASFSTTVPELQGNEFQMNPSLEKDFGNPSNNKSQPEHPTGEESTENKAIANLDNGMLIPQSEDVKTTTEKPEDSLYLDTTTSFTTETTTQNFEETTRPPASSQDQDVLVKAVNDIRTSKQAGGDGDYMKNIRGIINKKASLWLAGNKRPRFRRKRTVTDYLKTPGEPFLNFQLQNGMQDTHISRKAHLSRGLPKLLFLIDGAIDTPVPMMICTSKFPYAYIPQLHAKALEFPLDDVRYKLLILLPIDRRGLRQLIYDLADFPLRNVFESLRPEGVKAIIPSFMVEGFVILTSSLRKLGIWNVFDPQKANLSGMSNEPDLYVRNVEQSITVVIRNYVEILDVQTRTMAARCIDFEFDASHPFLYFVLDTTTNVALMAGQILNPLSSTIY